MLCTPFGETTGDGMTCGMNSRHVEAVGTCELKRDVALEMKPCWREPLENVPKKADFTQNKGRKYAVCINIQKNTDPERRLSALP
jgi:hypothetical protein